VKKGRPDRVTVEVPAWIIGLGDRANQSALVLVAAAAGGLAGLGIAWSGVAATLDVWRQVPFLASGALGGVAVTGVCLGLVAVERERRAGAVDRLWLDAAIQSASEMADALPVALASLAAKDRPQLVTNGRTVHRPDCRMAAGRNLDPVEPDVRAGLRACLICRP
jgi:hypothetical protein